MLYFKRIEKKDKRRWTMFYEDATTKEIEQVVELQLQSNPVSNNFEKFAKTIEDISIKIEGFDIWFKETIDKYIEEEYNSEIVFEQVETIKQYAEQYVNILNIDFESFINRKKASKTSIVFQPNEIRALSVSTVALKIYSVFYCDEIMKLPKNISNQIYEELIRDCITLGVTDKIFQMIRARCFRSSQNDKYMWDIVSMYICETPESYILHVFNFVMSRLLFLITPDMNPIPYIVSSVDDSINWLMHSIYRNRVIYDDSFGGSEDIYGSVLSKDSYYVLCCNDTIAKAASIGMQLVEDDKTMNNEDQINFNERLDKIKQLYPTMKLVILPLASRILEIPYKYLLTNPPRHVILTGIFLRKLIEDTLPGEVRKGTIEGKKKELFLVWSDLYSNFLEFLTAIPHQKSSQATKSSYKIRDINRILNDKSPIFGFKSPTLKNNIISSICGVLSASKNDLIDIKTGRKLTKMKYADLEKDVCDFYINLYSGGLDESLKKLSEKANDYF